MIASTAALVQNIPGMLYNGESFFSLAIPGSAPAGLADFGTRFKAAFKSVPPGVRLFVSLTNVTIDPTTGLATGQVLSTSTSFAQLAKQKGLPYQTYIKSLLHETLVERERRSRSRQR